MVHFLNLPTTTFQWVSMWIAFAINIPQGILLFRNAQKRGRFPWLWGLWGVMSFPLPTVFYYLFIIRPDQKKKAGSK